MTKDEFEKVKKRVLSYFDNRVDEFILYMQETRVIDRQRLNPTTYLIWKSMREEAVEIAYLNEDINECRKLMKLMGRTEKLERILAKKEGLRRFSNMVQERNWDNLKEEYGVLSRDENTVFELVYDEITKE